jgi:hypothetical protein
MTENLLKQAAPGNVSTQNPKMEKSTDYADYTDLRG